MRIVAHNTFNVRIVLVRVYAPDICPSACGIGEFCVTPEALRPGFVNDEFRTLLRRVIVRSITCRAMAVFALNYRVRCLIDDLNLVSVAA